MGQELDASDDPRRRHRRDPRAVHHRVRADIRTFVCGLEGRIEVGSLATESSSVVSGWQTVIEPGGREVLGSNPGGPTHNPSSGWWASFNGSRDPRHDRGSHLVLTQEDNETICRVGPGTLVGNLMREYWVPAMLSSELPNPDCDPVRVMLLGEQLIGFRDTSGKVGLIANLCTHRGRACSSAETRRTGSAASITAGSSTRSATASTCRTSRLSRTSRTASPPPLIPASSGQELSGPTWAHETLHRRFLTSSQRCSPRGSTGPMPSNASATGSKVSRVTSTRSTSGSCTADTGGSRTPFQGAWRITAWRIGRLATRWSPRT